MPSTNSQKLRIKGGDTLLTIHAPADFKKSLDPPDGVRISNNAINYQQIHWFVKDRAQMEKELKRVLPLIKEEVTCWIYYPKGTSKIRTDLTRDKGWGELLKNDQLQWISLVSFDDTWSAFGMRHKTESDKKKEQKPKERAIFEYIDPEKKIVRLPEDFDLELNQSLQGIAIPEGTPHPRRQRERHWLVGYSCSSYCAIGRDAGLMGDSGRNDIAARTPM